MKRRQTCQEQWLDCNDLRSPQSCLFTGCYMLLLQAEDTKQQKQLYHVWNPRWKMRSRRWRRSLESLVWDRRMELFSSKCDEDVTS